MHQRCQTRLRVIRAEFLARDEGKLYPKYRGKILKKLELLTQTLIERKKQIDAFDKEDIDKIIIVKKIMNIGKKLD
jgi:hypothetical protein